jgi:hypothetical protein
MTLEMGLIRINKVKPLNWRLKIANQRRPHARYSLVVIYFLGGLVAENKPEFFNWLLALAKPGAFKTQGRLAVSSTRVMESP